MKKALNIFGKQGTGKSLKAKEVAERNGSYVVVDYLDISNPRIFGDVFKDNPKTIIVESVPNSLEAFNTLKPLIASEKLVIKNKTQLTVIEHLPKFIFTSNDRLFSHAINRRIDFMEMN
jgi:hypothetical protein